MNNIVSILNGQPLTTTLAVAKGVGYEHATVIRLVRDNAGDLEEFGLLDFESESTGGRPTEFALLNEQQATLLMTYMRNSEIVKEFKKRLVKAFYEMAKGQAPKSFSEALRLAADQAEKIEQQQKELESTKPKVEFHDRVSLSDESISVADAAKLLGTGRRRLFSLLRQIGWISKRNEPYQAKIEQGYLDVKLGKYEHPQNGLQQSVTTLVTGKGLTKLQKIVSDKSKSVA